MTFRVGCMVTCEDIPRAAKIPPASNATATNPIRRFIVSSSTQILMDCVKFPTARPRECNTQCFLRQARPRSSCRSTTKHILLDVIFRLRGFSGGEGLQDREAVGVLGFSGAGGLTGDEDAGAGSAEAGRFADGAIAVPDPALRERVLAPAGARLGVEFVKRDGSLLRRQLGQIDTGKLHGAVSVLQENLSGIVERFHFHIA